MKKQYIHILENNAIACLDIKYQLERLGYIVKQDELTLKLNKEDRFPDMIISNTSIQNQSDFLELKNLFIETQLPIICVGAELDNMTMENCKGVNIIGKFTKPFDSEDMINLVVAHFNKINTTVQKEILNY